MSYTQRSQPLSQQSKGNGGCGGTGGGSAPLATGGSAVDPDLSAAITSAPVAGTGARSVGAAAARPGVA